MRKREGDEPMIVRMWEAKAHPEFLGELLSWVCEYALPSIEADPRHAGSEVYSSTDHRVVVVSHWRQEATSLAEPPRHLVERPPHSWDFSPVDR
jgi:hypothetical protein